VLVTDVPAADDAFEGACVAGEDAGGVEAIVFRALVGCIAHYVG